MAPARQCCGGISLSQEYPGLADREIVWLRQMSGCRQIALAKQRQAPGRQQSQASRDEVLLTRGLIGLANMAAAPATSPWASFSRARNTSGMKTINHAVILPCQLQALLCVLFGGIQVVPLVIDPGQAKVRLAGIRQRMVAHQLQDAPDRSRPRDEAGFPFPGARPGWLVASIVEKLSPDAWLIAKASVTARRAAARSPRRW